MSSPIKAWSYSSYKLYNTCMFAWKKRWIDKIKDTAYNPAFARGLETHSKAEYLLKGKIKGMPKELQNFALEFKELKRLGAEAESDLSITKDMEPTHAKDWNGVWCRAKVDARLIMGDESTVIDFKTGGKYGDNQEQCSVYALCEYVHNPEIKAVDTELWYLDHKEDNVEIHTYTLKDLKALKKGWKKKVAPMFKLQKKYPPNPCHACRYCIHASNKGGSCDYNTDGRRT